MSLINKLGFWDSILTIVDVIPKVIYYLYASLASAVDALQALTRKLAGLDTYWNTEVSLDKSYSVTGRDPLSEFVYGILGVGNSAPTYKALNTVFWSLAIFGLIMLVISTMIAIIKSHYNEDTAGTSPWKYIYTAIKAILTFVAIPVVVVLGMSLSTFALGTLDKIISGNADEGAITGIYGSTAVTLLDGGTREGEEEGVYAHYDFFGAQGQTTSTPFSGMLFKASAYNANRVRLGAYKKEDLQNLPSSIFGKTNDDNNEYLAYQVDYAFSNCLMFKEDQRPEYNAWVESMSNSPVGYMDLWKPNKVSGFSKWNVSVVWLFYDLWKFDFIVGFVGVITCFATLMSIISGLITRLIKGAALFLIFPALLGIAPMDNFKAFKSWGSQFMQQILMVFGAILGMNLLLLVLPYIQNISFFNPDDWRLDVLNSIIDVVVMVVGLSMAKDFINLVNGFVGGADAISAGDAVKANTQENIMKGTKPIIGAAKVGVGALKTVPALAVNTIKHGVERRKAKKQTERLQSANADVVARRNEMTTAKGDLDSVNKMISEAQERGDTANLGTYNEQKAELERRIEVLSGQGTGSIQEAETKRSNIINLARNKGYRVDEGKGIIKAKGFFGNKTTYEYETEKNPDGSEKRDEMGNIVYATDEKGRRIVKRDENGRKIVAEKGSGLVGTVQSIPSNVAGFGKKIGQGFLDSLSWNGIGKNIADGLTKALGSSSQGIGLDKLTGDLKKVAGDIRQTTFKKAPDAFGGKEGDSLTKEVAKKQEERDHAMEKILREIAENTKPKDKNN